MYDLIFLKAVSYSFIGLFYLFLLLSTLLFSCIICFAIYKRKNERNKKLWQEIIATIISQAIFFQEEEDKWTDITCKIDRLLQKGSFRNTLIDELIQTKKNLSGASNINVDKLYNILELDNDSLNKLNSKTAHIKAKGIQELSLMGQIKHVKQIFRLTNNKNELVRSEAQSALVSFYGFPGLRFLNVAAYPISDWQQIQLLNKIKNATARNFEPLKKWLQSPDESVKVFALKLGTVYSCYDIYDNILVCLQSESLRVKITALEYFKKMPRPGTAEQVIATYTAADKIYKLAVLDALKSIGNESEITFLLKQLHDKDDEIKMAAAKALSCLPASGKVSSETQLFADEKQWIDIFLKTKKEIAA